MNRTSHIKAFFMLVLSFLLVGVAAAQSLPSFSTPGQKAPSAEKAADRPEVIVTGSLSAARAPRGARVVAAVVMDFKKGWHAWPSETQVELPEDFDFAIRTTVALDEGAKGVSIAGAIQWPEPRPALVTDFNNPGTKLSVPMYKDRSVIFVPLQIAPDAAPGVLNFTLLVGYQACDDTLCLAPEDVRLELSVEVPTSKEAAGEAPLIDEAKSAEFAGLRPAIFNEKPPAANAATTKPEDAATDAATPVSPPSAGGGSFFGFSLDGLAESRFGWVVLALLGVVGGFILNLTPCVLPVIPIKVLTLTQHAGSPGRSLVLGLWMALGVVMFWLGLGIPAAFVSSFADPSIMFGIWWLTTGIGAVIGLLGLGIMGLFTINLPQSLYMVNPEANSPFGSFMFGVMTAVLGLPCFGFVAGALLPVATTLGPAVTITIFAAMGVGMALPYLVLAMKPQWIDRLPRTGPASELVKQVMGLLLLAAAAYFMGSGLIALVQDYPYIGKRLHWWAVALFGVAAGAWLVYRTVQITPSFGKRLTFGVIGAVLALGGVLAAWGATEQARRGYEEREAALAKVAMQETGGAIATGVWLEYSEAKVKQALAEGKTIVMDFTAEWCVNCKTLKAAVLNVSPVKPALQEKDVVLFEVDLTSRRAPGWEKLRAFGRSGIPLLVVQGPGLKDPWLSNAYTPDQVLEALRLARGGTSE